ncbi:hypothetical protein [Streptomyces sp. CC228A]|uniref:hypothetical protein n=1 Tax=Streptomyces sp. CC228A TaxID=2898186 RepID=UPI001F19316B|nr:hypothetical protein [Streptomyces sp. CC228A]
MALSAITALALALVAGLLVWGGLSTGPGALTARRDLTYLKPFEEAVADLREAPGLRYRDTATAGITERDITVTASGSQFGRTGSGVRRHDQDVLRVGGREFTRWRVDPAPGRPTEGGKPAAEKPGAWTVGSHGASVILEEVLDNRPPPARLAALLSQALAEQADSRREPGEARRGLTVNGTPARALDTSAGRLLITQRTPHRVLRLQPYDLSERADALRDGETPTDIPQVTIGPLAGHSSEGLDLTVIDKDAVDAMFDTLLEYTKQLKDATDQGISFQLDGSGDVKCGPGGCTATQKFRGRVTTRAKARITGGTVTAVMDAAFTIGDRPAGRCTSRRGTFALAGSTVSGTLTCSEPAAGPVYTSVAAQRKADALARSRATGRPVRYSIPFRATTLVDARALAAVEVKRLVERVERERAAVARAASGRGASAS